MSIDFDEIRAASPLVDTVARYVDLTKRGTEYVGLCPFHTESTPSFKVWHGRKGWMFTCHGCGMHGDVLDFVAGVNGETVKDAATRLRKGDIPAAGITPEAQPSRVDDSGEWSAIVPPPDDAPLWDPSRTWNHKSARMVDYSRAERTDAYRDADGRILFHVARLLLSGGDGGKKVTPVVSWAQHKDGRAMWATVRPPAPYPFLGLDILADCPALPALVFEGEKKRAAVESVTDAYACVSVLGGTNGVRKMDVSALRGRAVILWPDADAPGRAMMSELGRRLSGIAASIAYIDTAGLPDGYDGGDLVETGADAAVVEAWIAKRLTDDPPEAPAQTDADQKKPKLTAVPRASVAEPVVPPRDPERTRGAQLSQAKNTVVALRKADPEPDLGIPPEYSDDQLADEFARRFMSQYCFVAEWGSRWLEWSGSRWQIDKSLMVRYAIRVDVCRKAAMDAANRIDLGAKGPKIANLLGSARTVGSVDILARCDRRLAATPDRFDADEWTINTPAGLLDLRTGITRAAVPGDYCTKVTAASPRGECPEWHKFIVKACGGDMELVAFLQRWAGYCMTGSVREEKFIFFHGEGGSGKGTFLGAVQHTLGDYAITTPMETFTKKKMDGGVPADLADLNAARMVVSQETEEGKSWNEQRLKACTGSDMIKARFMRENYFEFKPTFKLTFAGNHKPQLDNVDVAIKRRLFMIPFDQVVPVEQQDHGLKERLILEADGIMQWMLDGCLEWQRIGLSPPERVRVATGEYFEDQDLMSTFLASCCDTTDSTARTPLSTLYAKYLSWCRTVGEDPRNRRRFVEAMEQKGIRKSGRGSIRTDDGRRQTGVVMLAGVTVMDTHGLMTEIGWN